MGTPLRQQLRAEMSRIATNLDRRWLTAASKEICSELDYLLSDSAFDSYTHVLAWVDTHIGDVDLSRFAFSQMEHRAVYVPQQRHDHSLEFFELTEQALSQQQSAIDAASMNLVPYPAGVAQQTIVLVPGVAFDQYGHRLGRGWASYSRLFQTSLQRALKIGVCWEFQVLPQIPSGGDPTVMNWVVHERGSIQIA
jgi:5,10-methenyltetrahydrofolate synthetase